MCNYSFEKKCFDNWLAVSERKGGKLSLHLKKKILVLVFFVPLHLAVMGVFPAQGGSGINARVKKITDSEIITYDLGFFKFTYLPPRYGVI